MSILSTNLPKLLWHQAAAPLRTGTGDAAQPHTSCLQCLLPVFGRPGRLHSRTIDGHWRAPPVSTTGWLSSWTAAAGLGRRTIKMQVSAPSTTAAAAIARVGRIAVA